MSGSAATARVVALGSWFVLLWLMLWADLSAANLLSGLALAAGVILLTRDFARETSGEAARLSPPAMIVFVGHVLWQLVRSNLSLALEIVTPRNSIEVGTVDVELRSDSPLVAMAVSNVVTLTPGTVTIGVGGDPMTLTIGVLHLHDPDDVRAGVRRTEELAIKAFGTAASRRALREEAGP